MRVLLRWLCGLSAALVLALPASAEPPMWRIKSQAGEVVLFGSVHLLAPDLQWRSPALDAELARAGSLWFEVPIDRDTQATVARLIGARNLLPVGGSLSALLSRQGRERLTNVCGRLGLPVQAIDGAQPWFAEVTLTLLHLQSRGVRQGSGVEESLARIAPANLPRRAFETPAEQVAILAGASRKEQIASLEETLEEIDERPETFDDLQKAWVAGDVGWIVREAVEPIRRAAPGLYERLVAARNRRWADEIERLLKAPERALIVVGVGHLVGPDSVPALLRRRGIAVEGP